MTHDAHDLTPPTRSDTFAHDAHESEAERAARVAQPPAPPVSRGWWDDGAEIPNDPDNVRFKARKAWQDAQGVPQEQQALADRLTAEAVAIAAGQTPVNRRGTDPAPAPPSHPDAAAQQARDAAAQATADAREAARLNAEAQAASDASRQAAIEALKKT